MTGNLGPLSDCYNHISSPIKLSNGENVLATHVNFFTFNFDLHLDNILHVHSFKFNLLYLSKLTKVLNYSFTFFFLIFVYFKT